MTTIEEMYQRYNSMLAYSIKKFYEDNKGMLLQEDPAIKKVALLKLKPLLDTSAIITKKLPEEYVPLQKPIKKIYALLYTHTFLRKSYLELLESENLARIRAAEQQIVQEIERALAKGTSTTIPKELKTRAATTHATILGKLLALAPAQKPFARTIYLLILLTGFNITSGCISQEAIRKKAWPGWEPIICALNEEEKIKTVDDLLAFAEHTSKIPYHTSAGTFYPEGAKTGEQYDKHIDVIIKWLEDHGVLDKNIWRELTNEEDHDTAARKLAQHIQDALGDEASVVYAADTIERGPESSLWKKVSSSGNREAINASGRPHCDLLAGVRSESMTRWWGRIKGQFEEEGEEGIRNLRTVDCTLTQKGSIRFGISTTKEKSSRKGTRRKGTARNERLDILIIPRAPRL